MVERICYGLAGIGAFVLIGAFFMFIFNNGIQRDCLNAGRTVIDNTVYACQKVGPEVQP